MLLLKIVIASYLLNGSMGIAISTNPSVIIIGSGSAGIAAATKLLTNNFTNLKILEAEDRIGGRINSVQFGEAHIDLGAEYCHGEEGNIVYSMTKDLDILQPSTDQIHFMLSNGETVKDETVKKITELAKSILANNEPEDVCKNVTSYGECLSIKSQELLINVDDSEEREILKQSSDWIKASLTSIDNSHDLSDLYLGQSYKICDGDLGLTWKGVGFKTILDIMMQKYPTTENQLPLDDKIFFQKEVINIKDWQNRGEVTITTTDGSTYEADHVIFTPSLGVLKVSHKTLFNPALPEEKIGAIENIGFGAILKIVMQFPERWWNNDTVWTLIWTEEDKQKLKEENLEWLISILEIAPAENNPKVLIEWCAGRYIQQIENLSDKQILEGQKHVLNRFLAPHFNITMPKNIIRTSWYSNPHFRGTYSYESVKGYLSGGSKLPEKLAKPLLNEHGNPTVLFAGEATHPHYYSTVHGAIESGYREAYRLINLYQN